LAEFKAHVASWKKEQLSKLTEMIEKNRVVGIVSIAGIPAPQMIQMRKTLRGEVSMVVAKNTLISLALKNSSTKRKDIQKMAEELKGQCALVATNHNPFKLYKLMEKTKVKAPAKGGEIAPEDIVVSEGETSFKPGPIIGDLQKAGIPAAIEKNKVIIRKTKTVVEKGKPIPRDLAQILAKMEIFPLVIGLDLRCVHEGDTIYRPEHLHIDEEKIKADITTAIQNALNLAVFSAYLTPQTRVPIIQKAFRDAMAVCMKAGVVNRQSAQFLLAKAYMEMLSVASRLSQGLDDDLKGRLSSAPAASSGTTSDEEKKASQKTDKEEEEKKGGGEPSGEDLAAGLGALFG